MAVTAPALPATITHLHAPASDDVGGGGPGLGLPTLSGVGRRHPAWSPLTGTFAVPRLRGSDGGGGAWTAHALLDFSAGRGSPLAVGAWVEEVEWEEGAGRDGTPPPALPSSVSLDVPGRVTSLAVHPVSGELVGAGRSGGGGLVGVQFYGGCV